MNDLLGQVKAAQVQPPTEQLAKTTLQDTPTPTPTPHTPTNKSRFTKLFGGRKDDSVHASVHEGVPAAAPAEPHTAAPEDDEDPDVEYYMSDEEFLNNVAHVKAWLEDMTIKRTSMQKLYKESRDMTKTSDIQRAQATIDSNLTAIKKHAKSAMTTIETLQGEIDYDDLASSAERMRHTIVAGLSTRLKKEVDELHIFESAVQKEYREVVGRRLRVVTGQEVDEQQVDALIDNGQAETIFRTAQQQQQERGAAVEAVFAQTNDRYNAMTRLTQDLRDVQQMMLDFATLVHEQGAMVDSIEANVAHMAEDVERGTNEVLRAKGHKKKKEKWKSAATGVAAGAAGAAVAAGAVATGVIAAPLAM